MCSAELGSNPLARDRLLLLRPRREVTLSSTSTPSSRPCTVSDCMTRLPMSKRPKKNECIPHALGVVQHQCRAGQSIDRFAKPILHESVTSDALPRVARLLAIRRVHNPTVLFNLGQRR